MPPSSSRNSVAHDAPRDVDRCGGGRRTKHRRQGGECDCDEHRGANAAAANYATTEGGGDRHHEDALVLAAEAATALIDDDDDDAVDDDERDIGRGGNQGGRIRPCGARGGSCGGRRQDRVVHYVHWNDGPRRPTMLAHRAGMMRREEGY